VTQWNEPEKIGKYMFYQYEVFSAANRSEMIYVSVENGRLLGIENGDLSDCQEYAAPYRRLHDGRAIAYVISKGKPEVTVTLQPGAFR